MTDRRARIHARASSLAASRPVAAASTGDKAPDAPSRAELWLYGVVGGYFLGFNAKSVADALKGLEVDELQVRLHSPGGDAIDGIAIGNLLRNHQARVTVVVDGLAASAASMIALAGDEVVMSPGSQLMLHDPWRLTVGNAAKLRSDAGFLDKQAQNYAGVYAHRAGGTADEWRAVMLADDGRGTWYTAQEAVDAGLANKVGTVTATTPAPADPAAEAELDDSEAAARAAWDLEVLVHPAARAAWRSAAPKPPSASAVGSPPTQEGSPAVAFSDEQVTNMRQKLGVAENADEATILAALDGALDSLEELNERAPADAPQIPEGHVVIPAAKLADLEAGAATATAVAAKLAAQERDTFLDSVRTKYLPTSRAAWEAEYDRNPEGTREHFASAVDLIPTAEVGNGGAPEMSDDDALYAELFPNEQVGA